MFVRFFLCFDRLKTSKTALICMLKSGERRGKMRYFGGILGDFSPFFRGIFPIVWRRTENQSKPNEKTFS